MVCGELLRVVWLESHPESSRNDKTQSQVAKIGRLGAHRSVNIGEIVKIRPNVENREVRLKRWCMPPPTQNGEKNRKAR